MYKSVESPAVLAKRRRRVKRNIKRKETQNLSPVRHTARNFVYALFWGLIAFVGVYLVMNPQSEAQKEQAALESFCEANGHITKLHSKYHECLALSRWDGFRQ